LTSTPRWLERIFPNPSFHGWKVVALCFVGAMLSSPGQSFIVSLYVDHLMVDLGITRVQLSSLYATMTLAAAVTLPALGSLADRAQGGRFLGPILLGLGGAIALLGVANNVVVLCVAIFLLRALGQGAIGLGINVSAVRWFKRVRSRALAMVSLGYAAGELVFPGIVLALTMALSWRGSLVTMAVVYVAVFAPLFWFVMRERSDDEPFDGGDAVVAAKPSYPHLSTDAEWTLREALSTPAFWILLACAAVLPLVATAITFHQLAVFHAKSWPIAWLPPAFAVFAIASTVSIYATGLVLERVSSRYALGFGMAVAAAALLLSLAPGPPLVLCFAYLGLFGVAAGILAAANAILWPEYFGIHAHGAIKGVVTAFRNGATAIGPILFALLLGDDETEFARTMIALALMCVVAAVVAPGIRPPAHRRTVSD